MDNQSFCCDVSESHLLHTSNCRKSWVGFVYMLVFGLVGVLWITLIVSLADLAANAGTTEVKVSDVFYVKGVGGLVAVLVVGWIFDNSDTDLVLCIVIVCSAILLALLGTNKSLDMLYIYYSLFGAASVVLDTGSLLRLIDIYNTDAGPWIGGGSHTSMYLFGSIAALINIYVEDVEIECFILLLFPIVTFIALVTINLDLFTRSKVHVDSFCSIPSSSAPSEIGSSSMDVKSMDLKSSWDEYSLLIAYSRRSIDTYHSLSPDALESRQNYYVESAICLALILNNGVISFFVTYLSVYTIDMNLMNSTEEGYLLLTAVLAASASKIFLIYEQVYMVDNESLPIHLYIICGIVSAATFMAFLYPESVVMLWIAGGVIGLLSTNVSPLLFDLLNRSTHISTTSVSIAYFGVIIGSSFLPPLLLMLYESADWQGTFTFMLFLLSILQIPLIATVAYVSHILYLQ